MKIRMCTVVMIFFGNVCVASESPAFVTKALEEKKENKQDIAKMMEDVVRNAQKVFDDLVRSGTSTGKIGFDLTFSDKPDILGGFDVLVHLELVPEFLRSVFFEVSKQLAEKILMGTASLSDDMLSMKIHSSSVVEYMMKVCLLAKDFALKGMDPKEFAAQLFLVTLKCANTPGSQTVEGLLAQIPGFWLDITKGIKIGNDTVLVFLERAMKEAQEIRTWDFKDTSRIPEKKVAKVLKGLTAALVKTMFEYAQKRAEFFKGDGAEAQQKKTSKNSQEFNKRFPWFDELVATGTKRVLSVSSRFEPFKKMGKQFLLTLKPVMVLFDSLGIPVDTLLGLDSDDGTEEGSSKKLDVDFALLPDLDSLTTTVAPG